MSTRFFVAAALAAGMTVAASTAGAQERVNTRGLSIGAHMNGSSIKVEDADQESGGGLGLRVGYGFTPMFSAYIGSDVAKVSVPESLGDGDFLLTHAELGMRANFVGARSWMPYLDLSIGQRMASAEVDDGAGNTSDHELSGMSFGFGGGVQWFFSPSFALDLGLKYTMGEFSEYKIDNVTLSGGELDAKSTRLNVGFSWSPMASR